MPLYEFIPFLLQPVPTAAEDLSALLAATAPNDDAPLVVDWERRRVTSLRSGRSASLPGLKSGSRYRLIFSPRRERFLLTDLQQVFVVSYPSLKLLSRYPAAFAFWRGDTLARFVTKGPLETRIVVGSRSRTMGERWRPFAVSADGLRIGLADRDTGRFSLRGFNKNLDLPWIADLGSGADDAASGALDRVSTSRYVVALPDAIYGQLPTILTTGNVNQIQSLGLNLDAEGWGSFATRWGVLVEGYVNLPPTRQHRRALLVTTGEIRTFTPAATSEAVFIGGRSGRFGEVWQDPAGRLRYALRGTSPKKGTATKP